MRLLFLLLPLFLFGEALEEVNTEITKASEKLYTLYREPNRGNIESRLGEIRIVRNELSTLEEKARGIAHGVEAGREPYAFWNHAELTIEKLLVEYDSGDAIYVIPKEIGQIPLTIRSSVPVPAALWPSVIETLLAENGVEVERLSPFLKVLRQSRKNVLSLSLFTDRLEVLDNFPDDQRGAFLFHTGFCETKKTRFLETMAKEHNLVVQLFEQEALIIGRIERIRSFAKLCHFILSVDNGAAVKTFWTEKISAKEAKQLLEVALSARTGRYSSSAPRAISNLKVFASSELDHLLLLCGSEGQVRRAIDLLQELEKEIKNPIEKTVFWYRCKHSQAEDIAAVLSKVYPQLGSVNLGESQEREQFYDEDEKTPSREMGSVKREKKTEGPERFIVDVKTGSIIMIVERQRLEQIQQLLARLDVPKQMVQIEVLLFEKKTTDTNEFGLESLKVGGVSTPSANGFKWGGGILNFLLSRGKKNDVPAYDLAYKFLLRNQDVQLNSCPSITTVNATPATISIMEEISIDNGITYIENKDQNNPRKSFSREKYGISITLTPTINPPDPLKGEDKGTITLETNINFESINRNTSKDRPDVTKRHVENQVRIEDGETVVIGGLRKKDAIGSSSKIPFLGQLPGLGKLFSYTTLDDEQTEMFIFITPRIISGQSGDREKLEKIELTKRPGDLPAFIEALEEAQKEEKRDLFDKSLKMLFYNSREVTGR